MLQITERSAICNKSPPSFAAQMPPPLIMQGMTRGGLGASCFVSSKPYLYIILQTAARMARAVLQGLFHPLQIYMESAIINC
jgi:hypothetical protein